MCGARPIRNSDARQDMQIEPDRMMVGRPARQHPSIRTAQTPRHATIETEGNDIARTVGGLPRPDVLVAGKLDRPDRVVVANNGRRSVEGICDVQQLPTVQELSVRKMHVRESHVAQLHDLRDARRHATWHLRNG